MKLVVEHAYTRDVWVEDDNGNMEFRMVPPDFDHHWEVFDDRSDKRTGWRRIYLEESHPLQRTKSSA